MRHFYSASDTHLYVLELERRVEALERLLSALEQRSVEIVAPAKPKTDRREYMRSFMAAKRQREREQAQS